MTTEARVTKDPAYMMGRSDAETRRLMAQSEMLYPFTRRMLEEAGISEGMRVLDVGSGAGDVALMAAEMVGESGSVVGVDQNPKVLETARARADAADLTNAEFVEGDCRETALDHGEFDAVVGRLVLMYMADPAEALRDLTRCLKPGGIVAFQDYNFTPESVRPSPPTPLWQRGYGWFRAAARGAGIPAEMGFGLRRAFLDAGLPEPRMELNSYVAGGPDSLTYDIMAEVIRSVLPLIVKFGIATEEEIDIDTLAERLRAETITSDGVVKAPDLVSAYSRKDRVLR